MKSDRELEDPRAGERGVGSLGLKEAETPHPRTDPSLAAPPQGGDPILGEERFGIEPVSGVHDSSGKRHRFPWPRAHAFLLRSRRLLLGLVIANMILAVAGMVVLGPWGFIPAAPLVVLVPLFMVATDLDRRAAGAKSTEELDSMTDPEVIEHPEERSYGEVAVEAYEHTEPYTAREGRSVAFGLFLFAALVAVLAFVAGLIFGAPLLGFGALFIFGYVALLGSVIAFAGMHELYEEEHGRG